MKHKIIAAIVLTAIFILSIISIFFKDTEAPCFMYHSISGEALFDKAYPEMSVHPADFEKQMKYISKKGLKTLFADEFQWEKGNIAITFDDGYEDNYYNAFPILKKYNIKATVFMFAEKIGQEGFLNEMQIKEMYDSGLVRFGSHTVSHRSLDELSDEEVLAELKESKEILEKIIGSKVTAIAYPYGTVKPGIRETAKEFYDYQYTDASFEDSGDLHDIHRIGVYRSQSLHDFKNLVSNRKIYMFERYFKKICGIEIPWEKY